MSNNIQFVIKRGTGRNQLDATRVVVRIDGKDYDLPVVEIREYVNQTAGAGGMLCDIRLTLCDSDPQYPLLLEPLDISTSA